MYPIKGPSISSWSSVLRGHEWCGSRGPLDLDNVVAIRKEGQSIRLPEQSFTVPSRCLDSSQKRLSIEVENAASMTKALATRSWSRNHGHGAASRIKKQSILRSVTAIRKRFMVCSLAPARTGTGSKGLKAGGFHPNTAGPGTIRGSEHSFFLLCKP